MRKSKFSEMQIVEIPKDAESGVPIADLLRKHGVSKATFFKWRSKYGGATVADVKRLSRQVRRMIRAQQPTECSSRTTGSNPALVAIFSPLESTGWGWWT